MRESDAEQPLEVVLVVPRADRRAQPGAPGNVAHDTAALGEQRALGLGVGARERDERRLRRAARPRGRARRAARPGARRASRARSCTASQPADSSSSIAASAQATASALSDSASKRRASSCSARVEARVRVREVGVAAPRDAQALAQLRADVEHARAVGPAQPLLPGAGVGVAAERAHVDGDRADALRAVEQHRHVDLGELGGRERAAHPADVRAGDEARARPDRLGDLARAALRGSTTPRSSRAARERAEQAGVLLVAREDLIAGAEREAADHLRHALARARRQRDVGRRRRRAPARRRRAAAPFSSLRRSKCAHRAPVGGLALELAARPPARRASGSGPSVPAFR